MFTLYYYFVIQYVFSFLNYYLFVVLEITPLLLCKLNLNLNNYLFILRNTTSFKINSLEMKPPSDKE